MITSSSGPALLRARPSDRLRETLAEWGDSLPEKWSKGFKGVDLDFGGFDHSSKASGPEPFWPTKGKSPNGEPRSLFKPFEDLSPADVQVAIFGNDPYPEQERATGRSFEQGDMTDWRADLRQPGRVSRSLRAIALAASAFHITHSAPDRLDVTSRARLREALRQGASGLPPPNRCFASWAEQGVLWVNRALTHSTEADKPAHLRLWQPFTNCLLRILAEQSGDKPVVVALWGGKARKLMSETITGRGRGVQFVTVDHPSSPGGGFFKRGNPLVDVNDALGAGRAIAWMPKAS